MAFAVHGTLPGLHASGLATMHIAGLLRNLIEIGSCAAFFADTAY